ncbi:TetR/AcrR family transcriptional regulator [Allosalinactinospora lopnorensis]|uniref:TetR/AcrR family transcriptional regulator n=1 Tax=Allosalinactinospora lopnorensis TaxID=1352348 RepID=UPI000623F627|nr:TetR/AcrR family transcriptional regulator [Allosalinactinospora lopnorensis]
MATEDNEANRPPSSLELLWGVRDRPRRGPKPKLTVAGIVQAAVDLADAEGIDALSMQRIAKEFGYTTMSLYRYVPGKEQLLDLMFDAGSGPVPPVEEDVRDWRGEIGWWVRAQQRIYRRHPWMLRVAIDRPPVGPNNLAWMEAGLRATAKSGLSQVESIELIMFVTGAVRELSRIEEDMRQRLRSSGTTARQMDLDYAAALKRVVDPGTYPTLAGMLADGVFDSPAPREPGEPGELMETELTFGLQRLFDGIESYVRARASGEEPERR